MEISFGFDVVKIMDIVNLNQSFRTLYGIDPIIMVGICYYDLKNFFNYYQTGVKANRGHHCDFCNAAKDLPDRRRACDKSDKMDAVALANQYRQPFF